MLERIRKWKKPKRHDSIQPRDDLIDIRALLTKRLQKVLKSLRDGEEVSRTDLGSLRKLWQFLKISNDCKEKLRPRRLPVFLLMILAVAVLSCLLFLHCQSAEVNLNAEVSEATLIFAGSQPITNLLTLSDIGISGFDSIQLEGRTLKGSSLHLSSSMGKVKRGSITLAGVQLNAGGIVWLGTLSPAKYRIALKGARGALRLDVVGTLRVVIPGVMNVDMNFRTPSRIVIYPGTDIVDMDLMVNENLSTPFAVPLNVKQLLLFRVDDDRALENTTVRQVSTIVTGTLYFESLSDESRSLRAGQRLRFSSAEGEVRSLTFENRNLRLDFRGRVRGMTTGTEAEPRNLMPTLLEWVRARQGLALLWGSSLYVVGLLAAIVRWWRSSE